MAAGRPAVEAYKNADSKGVPEQTLKLKGAQELTP